MRLSTFVAGFGETQEEPEMLMQLTDKESSILLGATLMHWGVPFRIVAKHDLTDEQQAIVDEASEKLIAVREQCIQSPHGSQSVELSDEEIALLAEIVEDCLNECGSDARELSIQLKTSDRDEVTRLLERMRVPLQSI